MVIVSSNEPSSHPSSRLLASRPSAATAAGLLVREVHSDHWTPAVLPSFFPSFFPWKQDAREEAQEHAVGVVSSQTQTHAHTACGQQRQERRCTRAEMCPGIACELLTRDEAAICRQLDSSHEEQGKTRFARHPLSFLRRNRLPLSSPSCSSKFACQIESNEQGFGGRSKAAKAGTMDSRPDFPAATCTLFPHQMLPLLLLLLPSSRLGSRSSSSSSGRWTEYPLKIKQAKRSRQKAAYNLKNVSRRLLTSHEKSFPVLCSASKGLHPSLVPSSLASIVSRPPDGVIKS